jgi:hypothetical protein
VVRAWGALRADGDRASQEHAQWAPDHLRGLRSQPRRPYWGATIEGEVMTCPSANFNEIVDVVVYLGDLGSMGDREVSEDPSRYVCIIIATDQNGYKFEFSMYASTPAPFEIFKALVKEDS